MKFENTEVWGFEHALRGMRNPLESWNRGDSEYKYPCDTLGPNEEPHFCNDCGYDACNPSWGKPVFVIGSNDMDLAKRLIAAGPEHRKFLRQIFVSVDITAPLYWWKEADTYKVGTVANSTSTMHKLASKPITLDDCFEIGDYQERLIYREGDATRYLDDLAVGNAVDEMIQFLELLRLKYNKTKDKRYWKELVRWLPEGWLQTRTVTMNYENLRTIYHQRKDHKLNEWSGKENDKNPNFIGWISSLPYADEFIKS